MYTGYQIYQAERPKSAREQYEIDKSNAKLVAAVGRFGRLLARPVRPRRQTWRPAPGRPAPCPETSQQRRMERKSIGHRRPHTGGPHRPAR